ncbi:hypothetical protein BaRGS_00000352, partial [Batillaria attramentaria]
WPPVVSAVPGNKGLVILHLQQIPARAGWITCPLSLLARPNIDFGAKYFHFATAVSRAMFERRFGRSEPRSASVLASFSEAATAEGLSSAAFASHITAQKNPDNRLCLFSKSAEALAWNGERGLAKSQHCRASALIRQLLRVAMFGFGHLSRRQQSQH